MPSTNSTTVSPTTTITICQEQIQPPNPAHARSQSQTNIVDDFFGASSRDTSRHDRRISRDHDHEAAGAGAPPPYSGEDTELPAYSREAPEPVTLAMFLFKFGFLFPPFWILGALILIIPLRAPPPPIPSPTPASTDTEDLEAGTNTNISTTTNAPSAWLPEKTESERQAIIDRMRRVEVKWVKRCLYALLSLTILVVLVVAGAVGWMMLRRRG